MRTFMPSRRPAIGHLVASVLFVPVALAAAEVHPTEAEVRREFPSLAIESVATFEPADTIAGGRLVSGLHVRNSNQAAFDVQYPRSYDDPIVVTWREQRVVLRPVAASTAFATETGGKLLYERPYPFVDTLQIPKGGRSEELLLIRDRRAPHVLDYEIVEAKGVARVLVINGAVRFLSDTSQQGMSLQIDAPWIVDASGSRSESHARWSLPDDAAISAKVRLTWSDDGLTYPLVIDPSFSVTGSMGTARAQHTATVLQSGKVLITGGEYGLNDPPDSIQSAELYDPVTGTYSATGNMVHERSRHTATLLRNGKVLITGGMDKFGAPQPWAEIYDPVAGTFASTGPMSPKYFHTATLLQNGQVLVTGGVVSAVYDPDFGDSETDGDAIELYDPGTGTFSYPPVTLATVRDRHTATLLPNGQVLIAGGSHKAPTLPNYNDTAELYDPATGNVTPTTGNMTTARAGHSATLLKNGKVLIAGGVNSGSKTNSVDLYDPATKTFSTDPTASKNLSTARYLHSATLLPNGNVLIAGGDDVTYHSIASAEVYSAASGTVSSTGSLNTARETHTATLLPNGKVLIAGGRNGLGGAAFSSAELYDPSAPSFKDTSDTLTVGRDLHTATLLPSGKVLIAGGFNAGGALNSAEIYDPSLGTFPDAGNLGTGRYFTAATLLLNGKVLIAGGFNGSVNLKSAELFDPAAGTNGTFSPTGNLGVVRRSHTATLLPNGQVLIVGGEGSTGLLSAAELYDPIAGTFSATGSLATAREGHTATLLPNGKVLIAGGTNFSTFFASTEIYDPIARTFSAGPSLLTARYGHTATLLPNGKVVIAGGQRLGGYAATAELYDPAGGPLVATGNLVTPRYSQTATLLPNGRVLIAGGYNGTYLAAAELYDPLAGTFTATSPLGVTRDSHTATLLADGTVLIAAGTDGSVYRATAELYEVDYQTSRRPIVTSGAAVTEPASLTLGGSEFGGDFESSGGSTNNSATNIPLLRLQRIDNEQLSFVPPLSAWSDTSFQSTTLSGLASGFYRAAIVTNSIPSVERIVSIAYPAPTISTLSFNAGPASGGQSLTITGTHLDNLWSVTIGGAGASVNTFSSTSITVTTPAGTAGASTLAVNTAGGTAKKAYTYVVLAAPASVTATALTSTSVSLSWPAVAGASSYDIFRSTTDGAFYGGIQTGVVGTTAIDSLATNGGPTGPTANNAYLYKVRAYQASSTTTSALSPPDLATTVIFSDGSLSGVPIRAAHITELQTAIRAVHIVCGLGTLSFTSVAPGDPIESAALFSSELRTKLDEALANRSLPPVTYTDAPLTAGTRVKAQHILDLRLGVQ